RHRLNEIPGISIPVDAVNVYPKVTLEALLDPSILNQVLASINWVIAEISAAQEQAAAVGDG
ncbi:MAG: hypothetical protein ACRDI2_14810, partial [Chloroflexota bacterium]